MTYSFDKIVDRHGSGDLKHGVLLERYGRSDLLPLWVADMDFETPPFITEALRQRLDHSLFGYTVVTRSCGTPSPDGFMTITSGTYDGSGSPTFPAL